jgi:Flp pilus assembly protein CpaB
MQNVMSGRAFRTRGGALIAGIVAAVIAAILLIVYLDSYRSSVNSGKQPVSVLVAKVFIPSGTPGDLVGAKGLYQVTTVRKDQLADLALTDPGALSGTIAAHNINPGAQLTSSDFTTEDAGGLQYQIVGRQRAIAVPVDPAHGLIGQIQAGNDVDVYVSVGNGASSVAGAAVLKLLASKIRVLVPPTADGGNGSGSTNAILRVTAQQAPQFAFAADNARLWLVLRPQVGATRTPPKTVTLNSLLASRG